MRDLLHIYGQAFWHESIEIAGDEESLLRLAHAIMGAVNSTGNGGSDHNQADFFTNDGEGYDVNIYCLTPEEMNILRLPYTDEVARDTDQRRPFPFQVHRRPDRQRSAQRIRRNLRPPLPTKPNPGAHQAGSIWQAVKGWFR